MLNRLKLTALHDQLDNRRHLLALVRNPDIPRPLPRELGFARISLLADPLAYGVVG